jgi:cardiolipin synthase
VHDSRQEDISMIKDWKKDLLTIPNFLSLFRLLLVPVYMTIYLNGSQPRDYIAAAVILAVSCLTDMIDGKIARKYNMGSKVGQLLDPIADKVTQFALIICLSVKYPVLWNLVILFVIKESFQSIAAFVTYRKGKILTGALLSGKICTTVLFMSLILMVLMPDMDTKVVNVITIVDGIFMLIAFVDYIRAYFDKRTKFIYLEKD